MTLPDCPPRLAYFVKKGRVRASKYDVDLVKKRRQSHEGSGNLNLSVFVRR